MSMSVMIAFAQRSVNVQQRRMPMSVGFDLSETLMVRMTATHVMQSHQTCVLFGTRDGRGAYGIKHLGPGF